MTQCMGCKKEEINYKLLLEKYILHVVDYNSESHIDDINAYDAYVAFSEKEKAEIERIAKSGK